MARDAADALGFGQLRALILQLLGQSVDLVAQGLELLALRIVLLLQIGEVALKLIGLGDRGLKGDDSDLGWAGGRRRLQRAFARAVRRPFGRRPE